MLIFQYKINKQTKILSFYNFDILNIIIYIFFDLKMTSTQAFHAYKINTIALAFLS